MIKKISVPVGLTALLSPIAVLAATDPKTLVDQGVNKTGLAPRAGGLEGILATVISTIIFLVGALSVLMIVVGALRMVLSGGNPATVKSARETVLYAVVGLIIAVASYAIVKFVIDKL